MTTRRLLFSYKQSQQGYSTFLRTSQSLSPYDASSLLRPPTLESTGYGFLTRVNTWEPTNTGAQMPYYNQAFYSQAMPGIASGAIQQPYASPHVSNTSSPPIAFEGQKTQVEKGMKQEQPTVAKVRSAVVAEADKERSKYGGAAGPLGPVPSVKKDFPSSSEVAAPKTSEKAASGPKAQPVISPKRWIKEGSALSIMFEKFGFTPRVRSKVARSYRDMLYDFGPFLFVLLFVMPEILQHMCAAWYGDLAKSAFAAEKNKKG